MIAQFDGIYKNRFKFRPSREKHSSIMPIYGRSHVKWHLVENKKFWANNFILLPSFRQQLVLTDLENRLFLSQFHFHPARVENKAIKWYFSLQNVISSMLVKMKNYRPHKPYLLCILVIWCSSQVLLSFKPMVSITFELHATKYFHFVSELLDRKRQKVFSWA